MCHSSTTKSEDTQTVQSLFKCGDIMVSLWELSASLLTIFVLIYIPGEAFSVEMKAPNEALEFFKNDIDEMKKAETERLEAIQAVFSKSRLMADLNVKELLNLMASQDEIIIEIRKTLEGMLWTLGVANQVEFTRLVEKLRGQIRQMDSNELEIKKKEKSLPPDLLQDDELKKLMDALQTDYVCVTATVGAVKAMSPVEIGN
ncbi:unnamed protein product [Bemisia tabaci]|uniref:Uncharacterized protein n=2 Tax=Bemisia tabaci TaxID=7038 RepID=A0A9N9ZZS5_BEMTA|nr:unnamed protein product [Bemisia tabaci]